MSRIALTEADLRFKQAQRRFIPIASVIAACFLSLLPIVATVPLVPEIAFIVLIAWRLLRPELWNARMALPLGLFNDLVAGHPLGELMVLWTLAFLALDLVDGRLLYRDFWMDWLLASTLIIAYILGDWYIGQLMGSSANFTIMLPQVAFALLLYPVVARLVVALDRWRLGR